MEFRLIDTKENTPSMNMAIDEALLTSELPVLRFYRWKPAGLSIGYFQNIQKINKTFCEKNNIQIVRRLTGGNAVLHDKELTYSLIIDESLMPESITESYKKISKGILKALHLLKLDPEMNEQVEKEEKSSICFNDPSWYEILVNNKKIVGSAQKRVNKKLLQHGAILLDIDVEKYVNCFNNASKELIEKTKQRMTSINDELNDKATYSDVKQAMKKGFEQELNIKFKDSKLTQEEKTLAKKLDKEKYSQDKWNLLF
jgi:lipoate-protein ligase A